MRQLQRIHAADPETARRDMRDVCSLHPITPLLSAIRACGAGSRGPQRTHDAQRPPRAACVRTCTPANQSSGVWRASAHHAHGVMNRRRHRREMDQAHAGEHDRGDPHQRSESGADRAPVDEQQWMHRFPFIPACESPSLRARAHPAGEGPILQPCLLSAYPLHADAMQGNRAPCRRPTRQCNAPGWGSYNGLAARPHGLAVRTPAFHAGDHRFESGWGY